MVRRLVTDVLMFVLYVVVVVPVGAVARAVRDPLRRRPSPVEDSYFTPLRVGGGR